MTAKAKKCELCIHWTWLGLVEGSNWKEQSKKGCNKGHFARFYKPNPSKDPYKFHTDWGWKRCCSDFEKARV